MRWPDVLLLLGAVLLALAGPVMLAQEIAAFDDAAARFATLGDDPTIDTGHRQLWRFLIPVLSMGVSIFGVYALVRVNRKPRVRTVARRPGLVMLVGLTLVDVAYFLDWAYMLDAHYLLRAATTPWLYLLSGVLVAGATYRLASIEDTLDPIAARPRAS